jgi:formylglycine-generating enzyme required for sulfatase activity
MADPDEIYREHIESLRRQQELCQGNINHLEETRLSYGANVPLEVLNQLDEARQKLERIEQELERREQAHGVEALAGVSPPKGSTPAVSYQEKAAAPRQPFEPEMVLIPAGWFLMGSDPQKNKEARDNEQPQHYLYLPDYYLAKTPVTNIQYAAFVRATGHSQPKQWEKGRPPEGKEDHPVVYVSWYDTLAYCEWLARVTGRPYRLPGEAEWEKGARGTDGRIYPWGDEWDERRCNSEEGGPGDTTPMRAYPGVASPYGLLDMAGNVWEWTRSLWGEDWQEPGFRYPYDPEDGREDLGAKGLRVLRGGSFNGNRSYARCASRLGSHPRSEWYNFGFRVVVSPVSPPSALR